MHHIVQLPNLGARWRHGCEAVGHIDVVGTTVNRHTMELKHPIRITPKVRLEFDYGRVKDIADIMRRIGNVVSALAGRDAGSVAMSSHQEKRARTGFFENGDRFIFGGLVKARMRALND